MIHTTKQEDLYDTREYDKALNAFNSVLNVNGQHVPSLVLALGFYKRREILRMQLDISSKETGVRGK